MYNGNKKTGKITGGADKMKKLFENRQAGFWISLATAVLALASGILYIILDGTDRTFSLVCLILMLCGAAVTVLIIWNRFSLASLVTSFCYSIGFAFALRQTLPSVSDVWNKVNFIGGNALMGSIFSGVFLLCAVLSVVACFSGTDRRGNEKE